MKKNKVWYDLKIFSNFTKVKKKKNISIMAKSQDAKKTVKKEPLKTVKEKKEEKREKKNNPKRD
jgi:hypothetical protein